MRRLINYVLVWLIFCVVLFGLLQSLFSGFSPDIPEQFLLMLGMYAALIYFVAIVHAALYLYGQYDIGKEE